MSNRICYGYVAPKNEFYVTDLFYKQVYDYVEKQKDFVFHRRWGDRHNCETSVSYRNIRFWGTHYRKTFWSLYVYETNLSYFIKRKGDVFTYGSYDYTTKISDEKTIDLKTALLSTQNVNEPQKLVYKATFPVEEIVDKMIQTHLDLFNTISDKEDFIEFLTDICNDTLYEIETEQDIEDCLAEGKKIFEFYLDRENFCEILKQEVDLKYIINKLPHLREYVDKIDIFSILKEEKECPSECNMDDWIEHFNARIDEEISKYLFAKNINNYTVEFFIYKYRHLINNIKYQQDFLEKFEIELNTIKNSSINETELFDQVETYIQNYVFLDSYNEFVKEYGQNTYILNLTVEKEKLFNSDIDLDTLSVAEQKQIVLYRKLKKIQAKEMYNKNSKTIKATFSSIPKLVSLTEKLITDLEKLNMISLDDGEYNFTSFEQITEFISLVKE